MLLLAFGEQRADPANGPVAAETSLGFGLQGPGFRVPLV